MLDSFRLIDGKGRLSSFVLATLILRHVIKEADPFELVNEMLYLAERDANGLLVLATVRPGLAVLSLLPIQNDSLLRVDKASYGIAVAGPSLQRLKDYLMTKREQFGVF